MRDRGAIRVLAGLFGKDESLGEEGWTLHVLGQRGDSECERAVFEMAWRYESYALLVLKLGHFARQIK